MWGDENRDVAYHCFKPKLQTVEAVVEIGVEGYNVLQLVDVSIFAKFVINVVVSKFTDYLPDTRHVSTLIPV